jgi:hypothetical protein
MPSATILILSGLGCLLLCGFTAYKTFPREGRPESAWTKTENRALVVVMFMLLLLFGGITLLLKGVL